MKITIQSRDGTKLVSLPYSSLHCIRAVMVQSYVLYLEKRLKEMTVDFTYRSQELKKSNHDDPAKVTRVILKELRHTFLNSVKVEVIEVNGEGSYFEARINYQKLESRLRPFVTMDKYLSLPGWIGLYKFITCSNCKGTHSREDVMDILEFLKLTFRPEDLFRLHESQQIPLMLISYADRLMKVFEKGDIVVYY